MSVVRRCPTCGTTQADAGECEACFEGEVRYFCTNHSEGIWLDAPVCTRCGARFGDPPRARQAPPAPPAPPGPTRPAATPDFRPPRSRRSPARPPKRESGRRPPTRPEPERAEPEVEPRPPSLEELLKELGGASEGGRGRYESEEVPWTLPRPPRVRVPLAGCLIRFIVMLLVLGGAAVLFLFLLFGGALN